MHKTNNSRKKLLVGIIGTGQFAKKHAQYWIDIPGISFMGFYSAKEKHDIRIKNKFYKVYSKFELFARECTIIDIVNQNYLHAKFAIMSLKYNCNVILEKPIATNSESAIKILQTAKKYNLYVGSISNYFHNHYFKKIASTLTCNKYGKLIDCSLNFSSYRDKKYYDANKGWRKDNSKSGGGVLIQQCFHHIDFLSFFLGDIEYVKSYGKDFIGPQGFEIERSFFGLIKFKNGALLNLSLTTTDKKSKESFIFNFDNASFFVNSGIFYKFGFDKYIAFLKKIIKKIFRLNNNNMIKSQLIFHIENILKKDFSYSEFQKSINTLKLVEILYADYKETHTME